jgi:hypothetical protein
MLRRVHMTASLTGSNSVVDKTSELNVQAHPVVLVL